MRIMLKISWGKLFADENPSADPAFCILMLDSHARLFTREILNNLDCPMDHCLIVAGQDCVDGLEVARFP
jgi:hypothetical protein